MDVQSAERVHAGGLGSLTSEAAKAVMAGDRITSPVMAPGGSPRLLVNELVGSPRSPAMVAGASVTEYGHSDAETFLLPGIAARRQRRLPSRCMELPSSSPKCGEEGLGTVGLPGGGDSVRSVRFCAWEESSSPQKARRKPLRLLSLKTPTSCASARHDRTPCTPDPARADLRIIEGDVRAVMLDFDGTLTATRGEAAQRGRKLAELQLRAPLLRPRLQRLRDAGLVLGIISKSSELTIRCAVREAELDDLFDGPIVAKAVGFEGKAGFIVDLVETGALGDLGPDGLQRVLLIDDDVRELDRARARGIQTYAAPLEGGLQEEDFDEIMASLGLEAEEPQRSPARALPSSPEACPEEPEEPEGAEEEAWPEAPAGADERRLSWAWFRPGWTRSRASP
mmetsp:Transcript_142549/g.443304  ORF Transcript_142549/g.443304 Transcript_142549/m.443304 type:complete len:396 (+) Transcript_142549:75-1262(+)